MGRLPPEGSPPAPEGGFWDTANFERCSEIDRGPTEGGA